MKKSKNKSRSTDKVAQQVSKKVKTKMKQQSKQGMIASWITFLKEVKSELKKVTWPPRREIVSSTAALIVATILIGLFLGMVDTILAKGIQPALAGNAGVMTVATLMLFVGILIWVYKSN